MCVSIYLSLHLFISLSNTHSKRARKRKNYKDVLVRGILLNYHFIKLAVSKFTGLPFCFENERHYLPLVVCLLTFLFYVYVLCLLFVPPSSSPPVLPSHFYTVLSFTNRCNESRPINQCREGFVLFSFLFKIKEKDGLSFNRRVLWKSLEKCTCWRLMSSLETVLGYQELSVYLHLSDFHLIVTQY